MCAAGFRPHVASASLVAAIKCQQLGEGPIQQLTVSAPALKALSGLTTLRALTLNVDKARQRSGGGVRCVLWVGGEGGGLHLWVRGRVWAGALWWRGNCHADCLLTVHWGSRCVLFSG